LFKELYLKEYEDDDQLYLIHTWGLSLFVEKQKRI
jgi:hypothetical protein